MSERIRFHLDEHIDPVIARALRRYGVDVTTTVEVGLRASDDSDQIAFFHQERWVMVINDVDFLQ